MNSELERVIAETKALRDELLKGDIFSELPTRVAALKSSVVRQAETKVEIPGQQEAALLRIAALHEANRSADQPTQIDDETLEFLVQELASTNPKIRDKGAFFLISDYFQMDVLTAQQVRFLFERLQSSEIIFSHILEPQNDAVFLRSFAVMILSGLVYADQNRYHVLSQEDYEKLLLNLTVYVLLEEDGRGYVKECGWAHSYTHIGNLADELTAVPELSRGQKILLMATILLGWQEMGDSLAFGEDQRIAAYLINISNRHALYSDALIMCLTAWQKKLRHITPVESLTFWNQWYNRSRLLESLLTRADLPKSVATYLQKIIDLY